MKHLGKKKGVISRECSKCNGDLGDRYGKHSYCKSCHAKYMRENRPKHSELPEYARKKANARSYANVYLRRGLIKKQPCKECGEIKSQMHHHDYNKPLQIIWFCRKCHLEYHKKHENSSNILCVE